MDKKVGEKNVKCLKTENDRLEAFVCIFNQYF